MMAGEKKTSSVPVEANFSIVSRYLSWLSD